MSTRVLGAAAFFAITCIATAWDCQLLLGQQHLLFEGCHFDSFNFKFPASQWSEQDVNLLLCFQLVDINLHGENKTHTKQQIQTTTPWSCSATELSQRNLAYFWQGSSRVVHVTTVISEVPSAKRSWDISSCSSDDLQDVGGEPCKAMVPCLEPKRCPIWDLILKVVMPSDPTFHFRIYVYIQVIVTKLGILKGVTS